MPHDITRPDPKDRLIAALYAQLKAERETREALEWVIASGTISKQVLQALAGDPVPVAVAEDVAALERVLALDHSGRKEH
ncbi:hypothetical protein IHQ71_23640 [Rhizobium sp. TH2]|uniref:hypothetical protein n=1 Tax=Rhizobium sp. TH2 TaxID=2775403 RepID=UPI002157F3E6|nr:hypothetical protein [Rhizobium sp. TH2]UVC08118.1 hypothetical protein IHQ71_23640 [Rhizobium sp. TH2]